MQGKIVGYASLNKEEQEIPEFSYTDSSTEFGDDLEDFWSVQGEEKLAEMSYDKPIMSWSRQIHSWGFTDWEDDQFSVDGEEEEEGELIRTEHKGTTNCRSAFFQEGGADIIKIESHGLWAEDKECDALLEMEKKKACLNLSLNYQEVLDAWCDRGLFWADDHQFSLSLSLVHPNYNPASMGAILKEERRRREASVQRYKEKRQTRLFLKKIRYQVRKLNPDNRPRLKGRFVKRSHPPEKIPK